jgi:predicted nucleic acid-binding protein
MVGDGLMFLVDTNIWLEVLLEQEKAEDARRFFAATDSILLSMTDFTLYSIGIILTRFNKDPLFEEFLADTLETSGVARIRLDTADLKQIVSIRSQFRLDFDDAYQYVAAEKYDLTIVSFDKDFDGTARGRKAPSKLLVS